MKEVLTFLQKNPTFFIATVEGDQPRVRPFGAVAEFEGKLYFVTGNQKEVFKQLQKNPKVEICGMEGSDKWMRVTAEIVIDSRKPAVEKMLADNRSLDGLYTVDDGIVEVFYLKNATATFYSFTSEPKTIQF